MIQILSDSRLLRIILLENKAMEELKKTLLEGNQKRSHQLKSEINKGLTKKFKEIGNYCYLTWYRYTS